tara:strand:- start:3280 stop:4416 length:1137 start_codon:yes stop_codon:yes gene_type:complete
MNVWTFGHLVLGLIHSGLGIWVFASDEILDGIDKSATPIGAYRPTLFEGNATLGEPIYRIDREFDEWFKVSPITIHGFVALLTGVSHFWSAWIRGAQGDQEGVKTNRPNGWRWFEYSITSTLMTMSGFVALGEQDFGVLVMIVMMGVMVQYCGYFLEKGPFHIEGEWRLRKPQKNLWDEILACILPSEEKKDNEKVERAPSGEPGWWHKYMFIGVTLQLGLTYNLVFLTFTFKNLKEDTIGVEESAIFYALYYSFFPLLAILDIWKRNDKGWSFRRVDECYVILSFTSKVALFLIVMGGIMHNVGIHPAHYERVMHVGMYLPLGVLVSFLLYAYLVKPQSEGNLGRDKLGLGGELITDNPLFDEGARKRNAESSRLIF